jgi:hypothetical protein
MSIMENTFMPTLDIQRCRPNALRGFLRRLTLMSAFLEVNAKTGH